MAIHLFVAPAGAGKTQACLERARAASRERPLVPVWVCLPSSAQVVAFRRRLSEAGGALGVEVGTFHDLYRQVLLAAGEFRPELEEPLQHRLLRTVIDRAAEAGSLSHYAPLRDKPGFVRALHSLIGELKRALVEPARLQQAVCGQGPRLEELAQLYSAYQCWLLDEQWLDQEDLGWLATLALGRNPVLLSVWRLVAVDGFDVFSPAQLDFLKALAVQVEELCITLTYGPASGRLAQRVFEQALALVRERLQVQPEPLPGAARCPCPALAHLEAGVFELAAPIAHPDGAVAWLEAPNPAVEVREVLRWVKERLVLDGLRPSQVAILARNLDPYAPLLLETADEFGIPLILAGGLPLAANPAIAALLGLLSLSRRDHASAAAVDGRFPARQTLEALRSPYFNWRDVEVAHGPLGLSAGDVDRLERAAQGAQVVSGLDQWREALALRLEEATRAEEAEDLGEGQARRAGTLPRQVWADLQARFERLVERLTPPAEETIAQYTAFLEDLIGDEPGATRFGGEEQRASLQVLAGVRSGPQAVAARDLAALRKLKDALRGLVWAAAILSPGQKVPYERFLDELGGVVAASRYTWPAPGSAPAVWAASAYGARGLAFAAVAILGLSEGEFPAAPPTDPLLRDDDRLWLAGQGLSLVATPSGAEFTLFYEALTRARERLLLSRPYLSEAGQPWDPSPFWEETLRLFAGQDREARGRLVVRVRSVDALPIERAASWVEVVTALSHERRAGPSVAGTTNLAALAPALAGLWQSVERGAEVLAARLRQPAGGPFDGDCTGLAGALGKRYSPGQPWTASRLEVYRACPLAFFLSQALELEPPQAAAAGYDAAQLGSMYHKILERLYRQVPGGRLDDLLAALPAVADEVLGSAPRRYGFRPSQLWEQEQARIRLDVENTVRALAKASEGWEPLAFELRFGRPDDPAPAERIAVEGGGEFQLRGVIDRVDRNALGELRLIDYKSGSEPIAYRDLLEGQRIQLALYAWAAGRAFGGRVACGFYWHIRAARRSDLTLEGLAGGVAQAMSHAAACAWEAIEGAAAGRFAPQPGDSGCQPYCPGSAFCWRFASKR